MHPKMKPCQKRQNVHCNVSKISNESSTFQILTNLGNVHPHYSCHPADYQLIILQKKADLFMCILSEIPTNKLNLMYCILLQYL